jgi:hypothetical protein
MIETDRRTDGRTETVQYTPKITHGLFLYFLIMPTTPGGLSRVGGSVVTAEDGETLVFLF